jgi:hypothetical protein
MTNKIHALALEIGKLGMVDLAFNVQAGHYGTGQLADNDLVNKLLFDLGGAAGYKLNLEMATQAAEIANRIINGDFGVPAPAPAYNPLRIDAIWAAVTVEENGQEQFCRFLNNALMTPDPLKLPDIRKIAEMLALNDGNAVEIVKFTRAEVVERIEAKP